MPKYRVFELAKEFGATSKVILDILARNDITVKNHMSSVDEAGKQIVERTFARKKDTPSATVAPVHERPPAQPLRPVAQPIAKPAAEQAKTKEEEKQPVKKTYVAGNQTAPVKTPPSGKDFYKPKADNRPQQPREGFRDGNRPPAARPPYQQQQGQNRPQQGQGQNQSGQRPQQQGNRAPFTQQNRPAQQGQNQNRPQGQQQRPYNNNQSQQQRNNRPTTAPNQPNQQRNDFQNRNNAAPQKKFEGSSNNFNQGAKKPFQPQTTNARPQDSSAGNKFSNNPKQKKGKFQNKKFDRKDTSNSADKFNKGGKPRAGAFIMPTANTQKPTSVEIAETITVKDFADLTKVGVAEIIKHLMLLGVMATINQEIDFDTASLVANEFGVEVNMLPPEQDPTEIPDADDDPSKRLHRAPVVTIMGHVDHGKTSLLDTIRKTNVTAREAGGITQHIGAYQVNYQGKKIVFLDTPGHEAFTSMRARGAQVTDIAILVVAADDGVMPQTVEAINHAKAAGVPIIVAVNKIDKANANPDRVKQQLSEHGLLAEDWGGQTIMVPVSAHQQIGLTDLLEMILLVAEMQDLKANPNIPAQGTIIEAELDKGRGPVATVLVQKGTLRIGDTILAGTAYGKVRAMINERGEQLKKAGPSTPVEVLGLSDVPMAGDILNATDEKTARSVSEKRTAKRRVEEMQSGGKVSLDDIFRQIQDGKLKELNIVVKADVQGTIEALRQSLENIKNDEVKVVVVHSGVGGINESDVMLASAANALIIGFNVRPDANARKIAEAEKVDIRMYRVIYDALNDVEAAIKGMLAPKYKEVVQGRVEIRQVITISKMLIAGSYVLEGKITRNSKIRLLRNNIVVHEGELESLRRFKDDVKEVAAGYECGLTLEKFRDVKEGDIIEAYIMEEIKAD